MRYLLFILFILSVHRQSKAAADSLILSREAWTESLQSDLATYLKKKQVRKIAHCVSHFTELAMEYMKKFALRGEVFLESPDTLIVHQVPKSYDDLKTKEEKEEFLCGKILDEPESSFLLYDELARLYMREFVGVNFYADSLPSDCESFLYLKLHCYHILQKSFPNNATFHFMIGRWHYNYAVFLINSIEEGSNEDKVSEITATAANEIQLAVPWIKKSAQLYEGFRPLYEKVKNEFGIKE
ncbi:MAG: hypothetical protein K1X56_04885 [Flavobacteriales bacterium]|nr:hypothetical protein [Flavobacteriales bacterium]